MLGMQGLEFLSYRLEERIRKNLKEEFSATVADKTPEEVLATKLKLQVTQTAQPQFSAAFNQAAEGLANIKLADPKLDEIPLCIGMTWKDLMSLKSDKFGEALQNSLKTQPMALNKLLVLSRFKRQIQEIMIHAQQELKRREDEWQAQGYRTNYGVSVDEEIVAKLKICALEAQQLFAIAVDNGKYKGADPLFGFQYEMNLNGPGRSECTIMACEQSMEKFFHYCKEQHLIRCRQSMDSEAEAEARANAARIAAPQPAPEQGEAQPKGGKKAAAVAAESREAKVATVMQDPKTMLDLYPSTIRRGHVLTGINQVVCRDLIERLYLEAEFKAYVKLKVTLPSRLKSFPAQTSEQARKFLCEELLKMDLKLTAKKEEEPDYWQGLFTEAHELEARMAPLKFSPSSFMAQTASQSSQSLPKEVWEHFHTTVFTKAEGVCTQAVLAHRQTCRK